MIIYYDLRKRAIFREAFRDSGVVQKNHFRSRTAMLVMKTRLGKRIPDFLVYSGPKAGSKEDTVIVFDSYTTPRYLYWLCGRYPDKRIILWFWNPVKDPGWLKRIPSDVEVWTYSRADSAAYGLKYNTQFFFDCFAEYDGQRCVRKDTSPRTAAFVGRDKGRKEKLLSLAHTLEKAGVDVKMEIVPEPVKKPRPLNEDLITYQEIIERAKEADILLDYNMDPDAGLSLRSMEALFYEKKLITNNREILLADFYDPANIYVLDEDNRTIEEFLACPVVPSDPAVRDRYLLSNWLKRFDAEE